MKDWLKARAVEPSTWQGVGYLLAACGLIPAGSVPAVVALGVALVGAVKVVQREPQ